jgi:toxin ParE1/3/4
VSFCFDLTETARSDLAAIWSLGARHSERVADRTLSRILKDIEELTVFSLRGRARDDLRSGLRVFNPGHYLIFYTATADRILVARVLSGHHELGEIFQDT